VQFNMNNLLGITLAKALLLAGLSLFLAVSVMADDQTIPSRQIVAEISPTPNPTATPLPSVRPEELKAAEARLEDAIAVSNQKNLDTNESLKKELAALGEEIQSLFKAQADLGALISKQAGDFKNLEDNQVASNAKLDMGLQKVEDVRAEIEKKGERMENLLDLLNTLKRDLNDDSQEIADLKGDMEKVKALLQTSTDAQDWWTQIVTWRYLPLTAAVLGVVAVSIAASQK
jgi:hypothetical protein